MINKLKTKKAFTIIEVVLVLGIAGLIILAMFIAIPALQRSKRNQIRQDDMLRIMKAVVSYQGNHSGKIPVLINDTEVKFDGSFPSEYVDSGVALSGGAPVFEGENKLKTFPTTCGSGDCTDFSDPDGTLYGVIATNYSIHSSHLGDEGYMNKFNHNIYFIASSRCASSNDGKLTESKNVNDLSILYVKENGVAFCVDNQ